MFGFFCYCGNGRRGGSEWVKMCLSPTHVNASSNICHSTKCVLIHTFTFLTDFEVRRSTKVAWNEKEATVKFIQGHTEMRENMATIQNTWSAWAPAFSRFLVLLWLMLSLFSTLPVTSFGKFGPLKSQWFLYMKSKLCYFKSRIPKSSKQKQRQKHLL